MTDKPIIFNTDMIRAILAGRKTQTRRPLKKQPPAHWKQSGLNIHGDALFYPPDISDESMRELDDTHPIFQCPFGKAGDFLWVRERHGISSYFQEIFFTEEEGKIDPKWGEISWKSPMYQPRSRSRITLEITEVRVQRLADISEEDAIAEGIFFKDYGRDCWHRGGLPKDVGDCPAAAGHQQRAGWSWHETNNHDECFNIARHAFGNLWQSIYGPESWGANPWVFAISFVPHFKNIDQMGA